MPMEMSITRMAVTKEEDAEKERTMGRKQYIPYGLYRVEGFVSASLAEKTGFSQEDLDLFFSSLMNRFEYDRSAAPLRHLDQWRLAVRVRSKMFAYPRCPSEKAFRPI